MTVFLTTHFMDEAQYLADRVAVMVDGEIVASGPPEALGGRDELPTEIRFGLPDGVDLGDLPPLPGAAVSEERDGMLVTTAEASPRPTSSPAGRSSATSRSRVSPSPSRRSKTSTSRYTEAS